MAEMRVSNEFDTLFPVDMDLSSLRIVVVESSENRLIVKSIRKDFEEKLAVYNNAELNVDEVYVPSAWHIPYAVQEILQQHGQRFEPFPIVVVLACLIEESSTDFRMLCDNVSYGLMRISLDHKVPIVNGMLMTSTELQAERRCAGRSNALTGNTETFGGELATEAICIGGIKRVVKNLDADEDIKTEDSDILFYVGGIRIFNQPAADLVIRGWASQ
ncbi:6,7-dimethyl-8-ribityllumazine synthase, putative [Perkinsus marinus ATCC 50983]|uniref:6,7-dimethyl-8-ribityllumazine synthase n=1 Tax=Perkinsus marinus (strain ATCC 50983 / TXsc) TaxID=423536 RepID=C5KJP0_PERM5|nr:6,7-dimethyl-8-ribityllumazine synthase, putative [Perkinsus marinus ATCC 50983]EER15374.1 6,7-dimethyl-8-ribityllumazine synthase, putative [Perkinsus marinus ATCC 50983]|eukprot:XP_002783578.1 6,7-dimethyl-8-ribityllumazine synthase, putative [Perkinsus marinus ATCC 50983]